MHFLTSYKLGSSREFGSGNKELSAIVVDCIGFGRDGVVIMLDLVLGPAPPCAAGAEDCKIRKNSALAMKP